MKSTYWYKNKNKADQSLTVTSTGGTATAKFIDNVIEVTYVNTATTASYVIETPFGFEVKDSYHVATTTAAGSTVYVDNGSTHITSDLSAATDTVLARTTTIVDSAATFVVGDDDLTVSASATATAAPAAGIITIEIETA